MNICHCLFWFRNNKITAVLRKHTGMEIIKFGGNDAVEVTEDFWDKWRDYSGFLKESFADFCVIYDNKLLIPENLQDRVCSADKSIWSENKVCDIAAMIVENTGITEPIEIHRKNHSLLFRSGSFRNIEKSTITIMTAEYRNADKEIEKIKNEPAEITPFVKSMIKKLEEYDKGNGGK